jgi:hypothetical protein
MVWHTSICEHKAQRSTQADAEEKKGYRTVVVGNTEDEMKQRIREKQISLRQEEKDGGYVLLNSRK